MQPLIVVGDKTSHGGVVIDGSPETDINGKSVARIGNHATCPMKGHGPITVIVSGDPTLIIDGAPAACHGDRTACGAILLSSQVTTLDERGAGASSVQTKRAAGSSPLPSEINRFDMHFLVRDDKFGNPLAGISYKITLEDGRDFTGITDLNGLTATVGASASLIASLEVPYYGNSSGGSNTDNGQDACGC